MVGPTSISQSGGNLQIECAPERTTWMPSGKKSLYYCQFCALIFVPGGMVAGAAITCVATSPIVSRTTVTIRPITVLPPSQILSQLWPSQKSASGSQSVIHKTKRPRVSNSAGVLSSLGRLSVQVLLLNLSGISILARILNALDQRASGHKVLAAVFRPRWCHLLPKGDRSSLSLA